LAELVRGSAHLRLEEATATVASLTEVVQDRRSVVLARVFDLAELREVSFHSDGVPVVALMSDAREDAIRGLRAGASAVLGTDANEHEIAAAVAAVLHGLAVIPSGTTWFSDSQAHLAATPEPLTPRELEILRLLAGGDSNKTIAARLSISVHTVKFHISSILSKLNVNSRTEAVALGLKLGIVLL